MKKKWFILIFVLVIVGVVLAIVFVSLFNPRDTKALSEKLVSVTESGYLSPDNEENQEIDEYLAYLKTLSEEFEDTSEISKITNYLDAYASYEIVAKFFAREMIFANATEYYTNNHKNIENWLDSAQKNANEIKKYLEGLKLGNNRYWTARSWSDVYKKVQNLVNDTAKALSKLSEVYQKCVPAVSAGKGYANNTLTDVIFAEMRDMLKKVSSKADENAEYGKTLFVFVSAYLSKENETLIWEYVFNENLQNKAEELKALQEKGREFQLESSLYRNFVAGQLKLSV